eukprot:Sspe_Gene.71588::Locus_42506_Transcript_1_1_Confidence_1.000_Length_798::g.71588::m.71588
MPCDAGITYTPVTLTCWGCSGRAMWVPRDDDGESLQTAFQLSQLWEASDASRWRVRTFWGGVSLCLLSSAVAVLAHASVLGVWVFATLFALAAAYALLLFLLQRRVESLFCSEALGVLEQVHPKYSWTVVDWLTFEGSLGGASATPTPTEATPDRTKSAFTFADAGESGSVLQRLRAGALMSSDVHMDGIPLHCTQCGRCFWPTRQEDTLCSFCREDVLV